MVEKIQTRGFPDLISEDFESKLRFKTQTTIIRFFHVNQKHPQIQYPVKNVSKFVESESTYGKSPEGIERNDF